MLDLALALMLLTLLLLGGWALWQGYRARAPQAPRPPQAGIEPQALTALANPYRQLMAEAVDIEREVYRQVRGAPASLQSQLGEVAGRISRLIVAALPQARQGSALLGYLLRLKEGEAEYKETQNAASSIESELRDLVASLRRLRAKVYSVLTGAAQLGAGSDFKAELDDSLFELEALEAAFKEVREL